MKKNLSILLTILLLASSCDATNRDSEPENPIPEPETGYSLRLKDDTIEYLDVFDPSNIELIIKDDNGVETTVDVNDINVDLDFFDSADPSMKTAVGISYEDIVPTTYFDINIVPRTKLKMLFIGNSFSEDVTTYMVQIANDLGIDLTLGNLAIGGASIADHISAIGSNSPSYNYQSYDKKGVVTNHQHVISTVGLNAEDWDLISLQQNSADLGKPSTFQQADSLVATVFNKLPANNHVRFVWHETWAFQQDIPPLSDNGRFAYYDNDQITMYNAAIQCVEEYIETSAYFKAIIPNGTSVQNARTSFKGDTITRDGFHMSYGLGRYLIGLTAIKTLTLADINRVTYKPNNVNEREKNMAIDAAIKAWENPKEITQSAYPKTAADEEVNIDVNNGEYVQMNIKWIDGNYYNSKQSGSVTNDPAARNVFACTPIYNKTTLPNGSVLVIDKNYRILRHSWTDLSIKKTEGFEPYRVSQILVDDNFWDVDNYVGFNASTLDTKAVENFDAIHQALKIYVPKDKVPEEENYDDYDEFVIEWIDGNYYSCTKSFNVTNDTNAKNKFVCTPVYTKNTLPNGSLLVLDPSYRIIRHSWVDLQTLKTNEEKFSPYSGDITKIEIDDEFWGNDNYVAFNVSNKAMSSLPNYDGVHQALKIYRPKGYVPQEQTPINEFENYTELTVEWIDGNYYSCVQSCGLCNDSAAKNVFTCTPIYTKSDLPNGTIIALDQTYRIIRHSWVDLQTKKTQEEKFSQYANSVTRIEINDSFWENDNFVAFNVSNKAMSTLPNFDGAHQALKIYIPNVE